MWLSKSAPAATPHVLAPRLPALYQSVAAHPHTYILFQTSNETVFSKRRRWIVSRITLQKWTILQSGVFCGRSKLPLRLGACLALLLLCELFLGVMSCAPRLGFLVIVATGIVHLADVQLAVIVLFAAAVAIVAGIAATA